MASTFRYTLYSPVELFAFTQYISIHLATMRRHSRTQHYAEFKRTQQNSQRKRERFK